MGCAYISRPARNSSSVGLQCKNQLPVTEEEGAGYLASKWPSLLAAKLAFSPTPTQPVSPGFWGVRG